ncbi:MAG: hypothetical protein K0S65_3322 [Labilithrix sp.]|nr:hypothetical protein [Labilithrix sp.]
MLQVAFVVIALAACGSSPAPEAPPPSSKVQAASSEAAPAETPAALPSATPLPASAASAPPASQTASAPQETSIGKKNILVVSFISPGDGTDRAAYERLEASLKTVANLPPFVSHRWGREGEHDECFDLTPSA